MPKDKVRQADDFLHEIDSLLSDVRDLSIAVVVNELMDSASEQFYHEDCFEEHTRRTCCMTTGYHICEVCSTEGCFECCECESLHRRDPMNFAFWTKYVNTPNNIAAQQYSYDLGIISYSDS